MFECPLTVLHPKPTEKNISDEIIMSMRLINYLSIGFFILIIYVLAQEQFNIRVHLQFISI